MTPDSYACALLGELGFDARQLPTSDTRHDALLWAASGAQYLTGDPDGLPLPCPAPLASCARGVWLALAALSRGALDPQFPAHRLLGERAALLGLQRRGAVSAGGGCRLLDCADGQLALTLAREDDWQLLPAWLEHPAEDWETVAQVLRDRRCAPMVARARLLGLAAAHSIAPGAPHHWHKTVRLARAAQPPRRTPLVLDLSTLWAGPLCTQILGLMGARVIKVESTGRPDGARTGDPGFFDLLNANKQSVALDLASASGKRQLQELLTHADIVIESARPRALEQMGIQAADIVRAVAGCVWLSITGYGRDAPVREWIAYGDDAGVAAGLSWLLRDAHNHTAFCGDAVADPLTGLHAALLAWAAWTRGGGVLLDISLYGIAMHCIAAGGLQSRSDSPPDPAAILAPCARPAVGPAAALGTHTAEVLLELAIR
jgi:CoA-transferase family III